MIQTEQRFYEDDVIVIRDNEYTVESVDILPDGRVLQYRLDGRRTDLTATLRIQDGEYVLCEYYEVDGDNITVIA